jgi:hypothetical protein
MGFQSSLLTSSSIHVDVHSNSLIKNQGMVLDPKGKHVVYEIQVCFSTVKNGLVAVDYLSLKKHRKKMGTQSCFPRCMGEKVPLG